MKRHEKPLQSQCRSRAGWDSRLQGLDEIPVHGDLLPSKSAPDLQFFFDPGRLLNRIGEFVVGVHQFMTVPIKLEAVSPTIRREPRQGRLSRRIVFNKKRRVRFQEGLNTINENTEEKIIPIVPRIRRNGQSARELEEFLAGSRRLEVEITILSEKIGHRNPSAGLRLAGEFGQKL